MLRIGKTFAGVLLAWLAAADAPAAAGVPNRPPAWDPSSVNQAFEVIPGEAVEFTVKAADPDGDPLSYSTNVLPDGATFDRETLTFRWKPNAGQLGRYLWLMIQARDDKEGASRLFFNITVKKQIRKPIAAVKAAPERAAAPAPARVVSLRPMPIVSDIPKTGPPPVQWEQPPPAFEPQPLSPEGETPESEAPPEPDEPPEEQRRIREENADVPQPVPGASAAPAASGSPASAPTPVAASSPTQSGGTSNYNYYYVPTPVVYAPTPAPNPVSSSPTPAPEIPTPQPTASGHRPCFL